MHLQKTKGHAEVNFSSRIHSFLEYSFVILQHHRSFNVVLKELVLGGVEGKTE
jgi:hypothetical protein